MQWTPISGKLDLMTCEAEATSKLGSYLVPLLGFAPQNPEIRWEKWEARAEVHGVRLT